jgi:hypothetical protein
MSYKRHVASVGYVRDVYKTLVGKFQGTDHLEKLGVVLVVVRITVKCILQN